MMHDKDSSGQARLARAASAPLRHAHTPPPPATRHAALLPATWQIDMDECMEILFRRFGKGELEQRTNEFFKHDEDGDNNISFVEFQRQVHAMSRAPRTSARARRAGRASAHMHRPRGRWASSGRSGATRRARPNRRAALA